MMTKTWNVAIYIAESDGRTHAEARLIPSSEVTLTGAGEASLNPVEQDVPEIGDELAVARALRDLAHKLLDAAADDLEGVTHEHVHLTR
jgi:hypothetical protein